MRYEDLTPPTHDQAPGQPERLPEPGTFNLDRLTDDGTVRLGLSLYHEILLPGIRYEEQREAEALFGRFSADMAYLAMAEPDRGRPLLMRLAQSDNAEERWLALMTAVPLCVRDYEFASDMFLAAQDTTKATSGDYGEVVGPYLAMHDVLPPDQAADLDQRHYERWPDGE